MHFLTLLSNRKESVKFDSFFPVSHLDFNHLIFRDVSLNGVGGDCAMKFKYVPPEF